MSTIPNVQSYECRRPEDRCWLFSQGATQAWASAQKVRLDSLMVLSKDTAALLTAGADTESSPAQRAGLNAAATSAFACVSNLVQCRADWEAQFSGVAAESALLMTPVSVKVLERNAEVRVIMMMYHCQ